MFRQVNRKWTLTAAVTLLLLLAPVSSSDSATQPVNPEIVPSTNNPQIGEVVEFTIAGVPDGLDAAAWNFGGTACDGTNPIQECQTPDAEECRVRNFLYSDAGLKAIDLSVQVDGIKYEAPQATIVVQDSGQCGAVTCEILDAPTDIGIEGTPCGGQTDETTPMLQWSNVENNLGYLWEVRDTDDVVIDDGSTAPDQNEVPIGPLEEGSYTVWVQTQGDETVFCDSGWIEGCPFEIDVDEPEPGRFTWWPEFPKVGERVRFADLVSGTALSWFWDFDDGTTSDQEHPRKTFDGPGEYTVIRDVELDTGHVTEEKTITVAGVIECGNNVCESGETARSCPADCALPPGQTGRAGGSDRRPSVPAAEGGDAPTLESKRTTEAWVYNPGLVPAMFVIEFSALDQTQVQQAGPFPIEPNQLLYWDRIVTDLFPDAGPGALRWDSAKPIQLVTRTRTGRSGGEKSHGMGSVGQEFIGIRDRLALARGDGPAYLIGLKSWFNIFTVLNLHEVAGLPVLVQIDLYDARGRHVRNSLIEMAGHRSLSIRLSQLGVRYNRSAYASLQVVKGDGRLTAAASLIDRFTGDPMTVTALHPRPEGADSSEEAHELIAMVTHSKDDFRRSWWSSLILTNPTPVTQTAKLVYETEIDRSVKVGECLGIVVSVPPHGQVFWEDVLQDLYRVSRKARTRGALHIYHSGDLLVDSRLKSGYFKMISAGTNLPALGSGDMVRAGESGVLIGLSTSPNTRSSLGVSEYSGEDTEVNISFFAAETDLQDLGSLDIKVPAHSHVEIPGVFENLGLGDTPINAVVAKVTVKSGGSVSVYGMSVDRRSGDPAIYLTAKD